MLIFIAKLYVYKAG